MSTLANGATSVVIPDDMTWVDEFDWQPVAQATDRTVTGALWVQESALVAGRPITLRGEEKHGWIARSALLQIATWAGTPGLTLTLTLRGVDYDVIFDRPGSGRSIEALPVIDYSDPAAEDHYVATLRFRTV